MTVLAVVISTKVLIFLHINGATIAENSTYISGDIVIGALFPIHGAAGLSCGALNAQDGIQRLVAAIHALKIVNKYLEDVIGMRLGIIAMDTCYNNDKSLEEALVYAKNRLKKSFKPSQLDDPMVSNNVIGVIGPASSEESTQVATLLKLFKLPQVSYAATSPELSDTTDYPYFMRTVPSDVYQAQAIISLHKKFEWSYTSMIYEASNYGENGAMVIQDGAESRGICFGLVARVSIKDSDSQIKQTILTLLKQNNTNGDVIAILYVRYDLAIRILRMVGKLGHGSVVRWIGVDAWIGRDIPDDKYLNSVMYNTMGVTLRNQPVDDLLDFLKSFTQAEVKKQNAWFKEYWQLLFKCSFDSTSKKKTSKCTGDEKIDDIKGIKQLSTLQNVRNAVFVFGQVILDMHQSFCREEKTFCQPLITALSNGKTTLMHLKEITDPFNVSFQFINGSEGAAMYDILMYTKGIATGEMEWINIGNYTDTNDLTLRTMKDQYLFKKSVCSEPCGVGEFRQLIKGKQCCWRCLPCQSNEYVNASEPYICRNCPRKLVANVRRNACEILPGTSFSYSHPFAKVLITVSGLGIVMCIFTLVVFVKHRETPIVKASSLGTTMVLLSGVVMSFSSTYFVLCHPTVVTCSFTRILLGLSYTTGYSAVFAKLYMLSSAFSTKRLSFSTNMKSFRRSSILSRDKVLPAHALLLAVFLITVHLIALLVWIVLEPPKAVNTYPVLDGRVRNIIICDDALGYSYISALIWPCILMLCCVIYAVKLRRLPEGFNDKNYILFCTTISILLWLVFIPIYAFSANNNLRIISLSLALSVHATILLFTLFMTKVYIILFRREKNTKELVMSRSRSRSPVSEASTSYRRSSNVSVYFHDNHNSQSTQATQTPPQEMADNMASVVAADDVTDMTQEDNCGTLPFKCKDYKRFLSKESSASLATGNISLTTLKIICAADDLHNSETLQISPKDTTLAIEHTNSPTPKENDPEITSIPDQEQIDNLENAETKTESITKVCKYISDTNDLHDSLDYPRRPSHSNPDSMSKDLIETLRSYNSLKYGQADCNDRKK